jgi:hypothetical protein
MRKLVAVSTALGVAFPEYPTWRREAEEELARQERRMKEMRGVFQAPAQPPLPPKEVQEVLHEPGQGLKLFLARRHVPELDRHRARRRPGVPVAAARECFGQWR